MSLAVLAMIGAAPVPVSSTHSGGDTCHLLAVVQRMFTSSMLSLTASRARAGRFPAPVASLPSLQFTTGGRFD